MAFIFEMAQLHEDALREYDELELCYLETGAYSTNALLILSMSLMRNMSLLTGFSYNGGILLFRWIAMGT